MTPSCEDYTRAASVSRRRFLAGVAGAGTTAVTTSLFGQAVRQASFGATTGGNVLVVISFRGGIDGMGMVVPHGDPAYYTARPRLGVPKNQLICQDEFFGLHPKMEPLKWMWDNGELAAVHAVGMEMPNRSHFEAMELVEDADPTSSVRRGWVNRMIGLDGDSSPIEAVHMGNMSAPAIVDGPAPALVTGGLTEVKISGADGPLGAARRKQLHTMWDTVEGPLGDAARNAFRAVSALGPLAKQTYHPSVSYPAEFPATDLSASLKDTAQLIKSDIGTEVVSIDFGNWDMHNNYGNLDGGEMQKMTLGFARVVNAFLRDLGNLRDKVTIVTISEFGRRLVENGNRGLDHGWGNMMLVMGAGVRGGRYYGSWPGLGAGKLVQGDLQVTTDYRQVLGEVVNRRFPAKSVADVFPGLHYDPLGVMKP